MATISPSQPTLTTNDSAILQALFDAESSPSAGITIEQSLPPFPERLNITAEDHEALKARELAIIRTLQPQNTSRETTQSAINDLNTLISESPSYPPAYVNRAQALRMLVDLDAKSSLASSSAPTPSEDAVEAEAFSNPIHTTTVSQLFADLGTAISLCTPSSPADPVSPVQARILADAHTHRGYLLLKLARVKKDLVSKGVDQMTGGPERMRDLGADQVEEMASRDFFFGGRFGNKVAQQLAVQTNPYAKMCGAIVKEALRKEIEG